MVSGHRMNFGFRVDIRMVEFVQDLQFTALYSLRIDTDRNENSSVNYSWDYLTNINIPFELFSVSRLDLRSCAVFWTYRERKS